MRRNGRGHALRAGLVALAVALLVPAVGQAAAIHPQLVAKVGYGGTPPAFARTANGVLHLAFESNTNWGNSFNGVGALSISPAGHVGPEVQALNWTGLTPGAPNGIPGLAVLPSGALQATFGGSPSGDDGPWGISSSDGGVTWSAPADVGSGSMEYGDSYVPLAVSNGTPVLAGGCCGGIVVQQGFGTGAPTYQLTNGTDNAAGNPYLAVDATTGAVIASWDSNAGSGGIYTQQVAPTQGALQKAPIPSQYGTGIPLILAARDSGPGVFAAYPSDYGSTTHIRLLRYGGGSVAVGSVKGLRANVWGAATGNDGRIWVIWYGTINGKGIMAFTRSNRAVTRFEPVRRYSYNWSYLFTLSGDGRLGPLDLLIGGTPTTKTCCGTGGIYYARVLPVLSASVSVNKLGAHKFRLKVNVTDAGDAIKGATVSAKAKSATTNSNGNAKLIVSGSPGDQITVKVGDSGYQVLKVSVKL
ncbi:MAG: sialidase family protein [Solirubrobacteraceae bacterium]